MRDLLLRALVVLCYLVLIALGAWWAVTVWVECRDDGSSIMYCLTLLD